MAETALHRRYVTRQRRLREATIARIVGADTASTSAFVDLVVPIVLGAQAETVAQVDAYMSMEAGLSTDTSTDPWGLDAGQLVGVHARRGDYLEDVYGRNHRTSAGSFAERMAREVNTDISLADRAATYVHTEGDPRIVGHRRVLGGGNSCGLCVVAATQRYSRGDLRPIHHACHCTTRAIYSDGAGYRPPSKAQLNRLYEQAGGTGTGQLSHITVDQADLPDVVVVDTVLGPTLTAA